MRLQKTMDGNTAASEVAYHFTEVASVYPITPSTAMAENIERWSAEGRTNLFDQTIEVCQLESEAGVAGAIHGALVAGALSSTFTSSQGLLLMIPNLYKIAAERLPGVFYVAARSVATHSLSIFGDHSDIYAARQTGCALLCASSVQEVMDLAPVAHAAAIAGRMPVIFFFDGFRTSHELQKIEVWSREDLAEFINQKEIKEFKNNALSPAHPKQMGSAQNPDIYFQMREASNLAYLLMSEKVKTKMMMINKKIGTDYRPFNYYGASDAEHVVVAMGSVCDTLCSVVDHLNKAGMKVGVCKVRLYRPFSTTDFIKELPGTVKRISVLDKTKEPGSAGEPLYLDVLSALMHSEFSNVSVLHGRYGLASKDVTPNDLIAVFKNTSKTEFTVGIDDDVTLLSLKTDTVDNFDTNTVCCKFWGRGADGTTSGCKSAAKIIGDCTPLYSQAYFEYDSKKSGGLTISHLRYSTSIIHAPYLVSKANFVACVHFEDLLKYDIVSEIVDGGILLINCGYTNEELKNRLSNEIKKDIVNRNIRLFTIDANALARKAGLGKRTNTICMAAFFHLMNIMPESECNAKLMDHAKLAYAKSGKRIYEANVKAIEMGCKNVKEIRIDDSWLDANNFSLKNAVNNITTGNDYVDIIQKAVNEHRGDSLPVSTFLSYADGSAPSGTSAFDKNGSASFVPVWNPNECIQCNHCSFVCPHAAIRPFVLTENEGANAPGNLKSASLKGIEEYQFSIGISAMDCTGCGTCLSTCPARGKALTMKHFSEVSKKQQEHFDYCVKLPEKPQVSMKFRFNSVKGSQFRQPLLEFSGACAGCGETPYAKLLTQLFGEHMYIANATGCSSIWANSAPSTAYTVSKNGFGPAWSNSLFEDAAEFGLGMLLAQNTMRNSLKRKVEKLMIENESQGFSSACNKWLETFDSCIDNALPTEILCQKLRQYPSSLATEILEGKDYLAKKSQWVFGGDGWAYDIGFGGLDHVLSTGLDINILVFDTEVYSNTGGQCSGATPINAHAKFAHSGKKTPKKDLASIAMAHGNVYVATVAMGADMNQCIKAMCEAENYPGPSIIIAYCPCISHGIKSGMAHVQDEQVLAVATGHWKLLRYDPRLAEKGYEPLIIDSTPSDKPHSIFEDNENRYRKDAT